METLESIASSGTFVCGFHDCVSARPLPGGSVLLYCTQVRRHVTPPSRDLSRGPLCVCAFHRPDVGEPAARLAVRRGGGHVRQPAGRPLGAVEEDAREKVPKPGEQLK